MRFGSPKPHVLAETHESSPKPHESSEPHESSPNPCASYRSVSWALGPPRSPSSRTLPHRIAQRISQPAHRIRCASHTRSYVPLRVVTGDGVSDGSISLTDLHTILHNGAKPRKRSTKCVHGQYITQDDLYRQWGENDVKGIGLTNDTIRSNRISRGQAFLQRRLSQCAAYSADQKRMMDALRVSPLLLSRRPPLSPSRRPTPISAAGAHRRPRARWLPWPFSRPSMPST